MEMGEAHPGSEYTVGIRRLRLTARAGPQVARNRARRTDADTQTVGVKVAGSESIPVGE